jgi:hypothetical protein
MTILTMAMAMAMAMAMPTPPCFYIAASLTSYELRATSYELRGPYFAKSALGCTVSSSCGLAGHGFLPCGTHQLGHILKSLVLTRAENRSMYYSHHCSCTVLDLCSSYSTTNEGK